MRPLAIALGLVLLGLALSEYFITFLLPRRVKRDPRIARGMFRIIWIPWRDVASRLSPVAGDTMMGIFGPLGLLWILVALSGGVIIGFSGLYWGSHTHIGGVPHPDYGDDLFFSAGAFASASTPLTVISGLGKALQVVEAGTGLVFLGIAIGYLPALFGAFSRRETAVSRLDPRAGSPPTAGALLARSSQRGGWLDLDSYLHEWETWTAELMETHLSYPVLGYFRSQHLNQNWLAALTTVVDSCAYAMAYGPVEATEYAELTFRIGRHALADLAFVFNPRRLRRAPASERQRLDAQALQELHRRLENSGLHSDDSAESRQRLDDLRSSYEPYAIAISEQLRLPLPNWLPKEDVTPYWKSSIGERKGRTD